MGKRELILLLSFTCSYLVSVRRGFFFLKVLGIGFAILLWHSLALPYNYFTTVKISVNCKEVLNQMYPEQFNLRDCTVTCPLTRNCSRVSATVVTASHISVPALNEMIQLVKLIMNSVARKSVFAVFFQVRHR